MKQEIHPKYYTKAVAKCGCGKSFVLGSTTEKIEVEICSSCHPFYTGKEKIIDTAGKVEKFKARKEAAAKSSKGVKKTRGEKKTAKKVVGKKKAKKVIKKAKRVAKKK